jgi:hypothetical protein
MYHRLPFRPILILSSIAIGLFFSLAVLQGAGKKSAKNDADAKLRIVCVSTLPGKDKVVLASTDEKGKWQEHGDVSLRASSITDWLPAKAGEMHLALRSNDEYHSICSFQCPADSAQNLVALIADEETKTYKARVFDPKRMEFSKGTVLVVNFSPQGSEVSLGSNVQKVDPNSERVAKPAAAQDGTYRLQASYTDDKGTSVPCFDRHVMGNADSREMLFLLPDKNLGMKVVSLPVFGSFE